MNIKKIAARSPKKEKSEAVRHETHRVVFPQVKKGKYKKNKNFTEREKAYESKDKNRKCDTVAPVSLQTLKSF